MGGPCLFAAPRIHPQHVATRIHPLLAQKLNPLLDCENCCALDFTNGKKGVELHQFGWQLRSIIPEGSKSYVGLKVVLDIVFSVRAVISPFISIMVFNDVYICLIFVF